VGGRSKRRVAIEARLERKYPLVKVSTVESLASFIILMKPGIVVAVLLAGFAGMVLAARGMPDSQTCLICLASLFLAAAGSAMINGVLDARMDLRMARLQTRVAALEKAGRGRVLATALTGIGIALFLAFRFLGSLAFLLILAAVLTYTLLYTLLLKRSSPWGTVAGGIPGALPVLIGYAAMVHSFGLDSIILFTVMLLWQPPHFWSLALEYRRDYLAAGVPVLAVTHGEKYAGILILLYATALLPASLSLWLFGFCSIWYAVCALLSGVAFLGACYLFICRSRHFAMAFNASILYLMFLFAAIIGDICFIQRTMQ
jgi:protoheme IX farnesyltransferase